MAALAALVAVLVALVAVAAIRALDADRDELDSRHVANLARSARIRLYAEMQAGATRAYLLSREPAFLEEADRSGKGLRSTLDSLIRNDADPFAVDLGRDVLARNEDLTAALRTGLEGGIGKASHRDRAAFFARELTPRKADLDSATIALLVHQRREHALATARSDRAAARAVAMVAFTCGAGLLLAFAIALAQGRRLRRAESEAREADARLRAREALVSTLTTHAGHGLFLLDKDNRITFLNPAAEKVTGYGDAEAMGKDFHVLLHPSRPDGSPYPPSECAPGRAYGTGRRIKGEDFLRRRDGAFIPIAVTSTPLFDESGIAGMVVEVEDITDAKAEQQARDEAARALRLAKQNLELATEAGGVGLWEAKPDDMVEFSDRLKVLLGLPPESPRISIEDSLRLIHPEDRERVLGAARRAMDPAGPGNFKQEFRVTFADGGMRWVLAQGKAWFQEGEDGVRRLDCFRGASVDITERMRYEQALKDSDERFRILALATNDAVYDWTLATGDIWWNQGLASLFGYDRGVRADFRWWAEQIHPADRERVDRSMLKAISDVAEAWLQEYRFRCADGAWKDVYDRGYFIRGPDGRPVRLIGAMMDVTARKRAEEELRKFRLLVEESNDFIALGDREGNCLYLNAGGRRLAGVDEGDPSGLILDYLFEEDHDRARRVWGRAAAEGQWTGEFRIRHRGTGRAIPVMWNIFPLRRPGNGPVAMAAVGRDMSLLHEQEEQLRQGQKMEAIGKLAGGIAHDFNNILTVMNGYGELLLGNLPPDDPNRSLVEVMLDSGRRAAALTAQLLAYGRKQVLQPRVLDLNEVVEGMAVMLRRLIGEDIELRLRLDRSVPKVKADPAQIDQILLNLCVNARDAMGKGGTLLIETGWIGLEDGLQGRYGDLPPGTYATLAVVDTGTGMDPEVMERIFEPFFTTKETGKGTGLGLSSAYGIVRQSGGGIEVQSRRGEGSTFRVYLPVVSVQGAAPGPEPAKPVASTRILLAEDEAHVRTITRNLLEHAGYAVWEARDGVEALSLYERMDPPPDLLLTDVLMPRMGGRQLAAEVRRTRPGQRILFMSGYSEEALPESVGIEPGFHFLQKPFTAKSLTTAVQEALQAAPVADGG